MKLLKRVTAMAMASMLTLSMAACGGDSAKDAAATGGAEDAAPAETEAPAEPETTPAEEETAPTEDGTEAENTEAPADTAAGAGGNIGVCIYKFDDAFMTTYRNALQEILEGKGYTVTFMDGKNDQAEQNNRSTTSLRRRWMH